jgi:hypothetical protein
MIVGFYNDNYFISLLGYGVAGFTLSYGTINFNRGDKEKDIVAINGIAFLVVLYFILSDGLSKNYNDIFYYYILVQLFCFLLRDINPINFFKYITKK